MILRLAVDHSEALCQSRLVTSRFTASLSQRVCKQRLYIQRGE